MKSNFNRGELNYLKQIKKPGLASIGKKDPDKAKKYQSMGKLIVDKIDDILGNFVPSSGSLLPSVMSYSSKALDLYNLSEKELPKLEPILENPITNTINTKGNPKKKKELVKIKKDTFMTDVGIEGELSKPKVNKPSPYIEENDKKIKEMLDNIDDIDNFLNDDDEKEYLKANPEHRSEVEYFKNLISEVDSYKKNMKEELDELQYLIKFVDQTKGRINRHKYGVNNMFTQTGLKTVTKRVEEDSDKEDSDEHVYTNNNGMYDKVKNISKIKNNLFNLQGNVLDYYQNFNSKMKKIEKSNRDFNYVAKDVKDKIARPGSSGPKLRAKSKPK